MSAVATPTLRPKEFHFPLAVEWQGGRRVVAHIEGKEAIEIAPPAVFQRREDPAIWSPEDFLVAAAAACLAVTFTGADASQEPLARQLAQRAEETCLVSASLDVAIETVVEVHHA